MVRAVTVQVKRMRSDVTAVATIVVPSEALSGPYAHDIRSRGIIEWKSVLANDGSEYSVEVMLSPCTSESERLKGHSLHQTIDSWQPDDRFLHVWPPGGESCMTTKFKSTSFYLVWKFTPSKQRIYFLGPCTERFANRCCFEKLQGPLPDRGGILRRLSSGPLERKPVCK